MGPRLWNLSRYCILALNPERTSAQRGWQPHNAHIFVNSVYQGEGDSFSCDDLFFLLNGDPHRKILGPESVYFSCPWSALLRLVQTELVDWGMNTGSPFTSSPFPGERSGLFMLLCVDSGGWQRRAGLMSTIGLSRKNGEKHNNEEKGLPEVYLWWSSIIYQPENKGLPCQCDRPVLMEKAYAAWQYVRQHQRGVAEGPLTG